MNKIIEKCLFHEVIVFLFHLSQILYTFRPLVNKIFCLPWKFCSYIKGGNISPSIGGVFFLWLLYMLVCINIKENGPYVLSKPVLLYYPTQSTPTTYRFISSKTKSLLASYLSHVAGYPIESGIVKFFPIANWWILAVIVAINFLL